MKKIILSLLIVCGIVLSMNAQKSEAVVNQRVAELKTKLSLTDAQVPKVRTCLVNMMNEKDAAKAEYSGDKLSAALKGIKQKNNKALMDILTPSQRELFVKMRKEKSGNK